jgi:hypothetical protein
MINHHAHAASARQQPGTRPAQAQTAHQAKQARVHRGPPDARNSPPAGFPAGCRLADSPAQSPAATSGPMVWGAPELVTCYTSPKRLAVTKSAEHGFPQVSKLAVASLPSDCPSEAGYSPVHCSNYVLDLGGAKENRTPDLLHAMNH